MSHSTPPVPASAATTSGGGQPPVTGQPDPTGPVPSGSPNAPVGQPPEKREHKVARGFGVSVGLVVVGLVIWAGVSQSRDVVLEVVKVCGLTFTGLFGVLALVVEYKDKEAKKITLWGKVAVVGVVASSLIAIVSYGLE